MLKSKLKVIFTLCMFGIPNAVFADYNVRMYCSGFGQEFPWWQCLTSKYSESDFELTKSGQKRVYKFYEIMNDYELSGGRFQVPNSFKIFVQNSSDDFVLGIEITDPSGNQVYQDEVGKYRTINVGN